MKVKFKSMFIVCLLLIAMTFATVPASAATAANLSIAGKTKATADIGEYKHFWQNPNSGVYNWNVYAPVDDYWTHGNPNSAFMDVGYATYENGVLSLHNFTYTGAGLDGYGIYADGDLEIKLYGKSTIDVTSGASTHGMWVKGKLTITEGEKNASLTVKTNKDGIKCTSLDYTSGGLTIYAGMKSNDASADGIVCTNNAQFKGGSFYIEAIRSAFCISGKTTIEGGSGHIQEAGYAGIEAYGNVVMTGGNWSNYGDYGIICEGGDVSIDNGALLILAEYDGINCDQGIYLRGGSIQISSSDSTNDSLYKALNCGSVSVNVDCKALASTSWFADEASAVPYTAANNSTYDYILIKAHDWGTGEVTTAPTCKATGVRTYTCGNCGKTKPETIAKLDHKYSSSYTVDKKATTSANGSKSKHCTRSGCTAKTSTKTIYKASGVKLSTASYTYNGKTKSPTVYIKDSKGNTISSSNYTLTKPSGRKNVGKYTYKIKFKNAYSGTKSLTLKINPKGTSLSSLTKGSKAITVKWKKQSTKMSASRITGYEVRYSTSSKMSGAKKVTVKGYSKTSKKITGLKAKKTYYVQVRTYKTVDGVKYYSDWSAKKSVKTK